MSDLEELERKVRIGKYRWRVACLSIVPLFIHQCGESYGVEWLCWVGIFLLFLCIGACIWLSCEIVGL